MQSEGYRHREENALLDPHATVIARWGVSGACSVNSAADFELMCGAGRVLRTGCRERHRGGRRQMQCLVFSMLSHRLAVTSRTDTRSELEETLYFVW